MLTGKRAPESFILPPSKSDTAGPGCESPHRELMDPNQGGQNRAPLGNSALGVAVGVPSQ